MERPGAAGCPSDADLAARALAGESGAWDEIVRRHSHRVLVTLLARDVPLDLAEDLVQETWVRLIQRQREGRLGRLEVPGLVIAQARWLALEAERTHRRRQRIAGSTETLADLRDLADPAAGPDQTAVDRDRWEAFCRELDRCPARAREVFLSVYGARGQSHQDVARSLGLSLQRVRQVVCEVRARLRRVLEKEDS